MGKQLYSQSEESFFIHCSNVHPVCKWNRFVCMQKTLGYQDRFYQILNKSTINLKVNIANKSFEILHLCLQSIADIMVIR